MSISKVASGSNFAAATFGSIANIANFKNGKAFIKDAIGMTAAEISLSVIPPRTVLPVWHTHKKNEEEFIFISGKGQMQVDDKAFIVGEGTAVRVSPKGNRCINNTGDVPLVYICVQAKAGSLEEFTFDDADLTKGESKWI